MENLKFQTTNHFMPFLWVHGEDEATYRRMIQAIDDANIKAFCIESRTHEEFLRDDWWQDVDIIIDEAKKRNMQFYILDDKHFPTGYANGAAEKAPVYLRRQSIFYKSIPIKKGESIAVSLMDYCILKPTYNQLGFMMNQFMDNDSIHFEDDELYSVTFYGKDSYLPLDSEVSAGRLDFVPAEDGEICLCFLTRNAGIHRNYINMLEKESVKLLIDEVYEKHYSRYRDEFGKTILGFFSDEPEIGNSTYTNARVDMGDDPNLDMCWSRTLDERLAAIMGKDYKNLLPLLWRNGFDPETTSRVRYQFMKCVTDLVSECFSMQIGNWCHEHGVNYIGHVIEDNNLHTKTGTSLGHYFKGLKYQSMAGIDDIGGQVIPFHDDIVEQLDPITTRDGVFYHYCLGKLAASLSQINPLMHGNSMCEIFGNYGWKEGVRMEKYLLDHFMVRGTNYFVPHAFTCAPYPDSDCPPHFYAHGNDPLYRHFGKLMAYGNRVCSLISDGKIDAKVAILYHAESEWCGNRMLIQAPAKELYDRQIDYTFLPSEVFEETEFYHTEISDTITVNSTTYRLFIIGECDRIPSSVAQAIDTLKRNGGNVVFLNHLPLGTCEGTTLPASLNDCNVMALDKIADYASAYASVSFDQPNDRIRCLHYLGQKDIYFLVNEGKQAYKGNVILSEEADVTFYDAFADTYYTPFYQKENGKTSVSLCLESCKSIILLKGMYPAKELPVLPANTMTLDQFKISCCRSIDYPDFKETAITDTFSGFISYETSIDLPALKKAYLVIDEAYEGIEVFVNKDSLGIQIVPDFVYDITQTLQNGTNDIRIEVASTLQRERRCDVSMESQLFGMEFKPANPDPIGITGTVKIYYERM